MWQALEYIESGVDWRKENKNYVGSANNSYIPKSRKRKHIGVDRVELKRAEADQDK